MLNIIKTSSLLAMAALAAACSVATKKNTEQKAEEVAVPSLELLWETDTLLTTAECVIYDKNTQIIFVANVNLNPWDKDGNGFISKLDLDGNIVSLKWVEGLHGPKGMEIVGNSLFVNDIDQTVEIDIPSGKIVGGTKIGGEPTLNDITASSDGTLYASGSNSQKVFRIADKKVEIFLDGDLGRPNGLLWEKDRLLMLTNNTQRLMSIDWQSKEQTVLVDSLGHADGIEAIGDGSYLVSNWKGQLFYISQDMTKTKLLDTINEGINAADIDYIQEKELLLVPTFFDNRVRAYKLSR